MNNRDPFNLRRTASPQAPFQSFLQQGAARAVDLSRQFAEQSRVAIAQSRQVLEEAAQTVVEAAHTGSIVSGPGHKAKRSEDLGSAGDGYAVYGGGAATGMAFVASPNASGFSNVSLKHEGHASSQLSPGAETVTQRIGSATGAVFGNGRYKELPMYKDKPYNYAASGRRKEWWRRRNTLALFGFLFLCWLYFGKWRARPFDINWVPGGTSSGGSRIDWAERRDTVKDAFRLSWKAYESHAWGMDEYHPISKSGRQMVPPDGLGWIIVDALDTMMLMNLTTELLHAREWLSTKLNYNADHDVNTFETTIRMLGGLLSAHYLSTEFPNMAPVPNTGKQTEDLYLEKATDLADRLLGAYESSSGVPWASVNLAKVEGIPSHDDGGASSTAEATTLQLEMKYLSNLTGEVHYWEHAEKVMRVVDDNGARDGLVPIFIYADRGTFRGSNIRLGSRGDSYYEYLIKQYLQTNQNETVYKEMWDQALGGVSKHLLTYSAPSNFLVLAERPNGLEEAIEPKMDHLVCFMPGTIALAATGGAPLADARKSKSWTSKDEEQIKIARELMKTCWGMYRVTATGLAPEISHFKLHDPPLMYEDAPFSKHGAAPKSPSASLMDMNTPGAQWKEDFDIKPADTHNLLRPETVESLFYMWRITKDEIYRHWGWTMFRAFLKWTAVPDGSGFSSIRDVTRTEPGEDNWRDNMESFWLAETLKYFYLLFSDDDLLPLDKVVFNTEAHPFPRFNMGRQFKTGWTRLPRDPEGNLLQKPRETLRFKAEDGEHPHQHEKGSGDAGYGHDHEGR